MPSLHKYIRFGEQNHFVIWNASSKISHLQMAHPLTNLLSAGFCFVLDGKVVCEGRSESLGLNRLQDDADLLTRLLIGGANG